MAHSRGAIVRSSRLHAPGSTARGGSSGCRPAGRSGTSRRGQSRFQLTPGGSPNPHNPTPVRVTPAASCRTEQAAPHSTVSATAIPRAALRIASEPLRQRKAARRRGRDDRDGNTKRKGVTRHACSGSIDGRSRVRRPAARRFYPSATPVAAGGTPARVCHRAHIRLTRSAEQHCRYRAKPL